MTRLAAFAALARLLTADGEAVVIGSFGTWLTVPQVLGHVPHDLDLSLTDDITVIRHKIHMLEERGFAVYSWQDRVGTDVSPALLKGRYYLRAIRDGLTIDMTYELAAGTFTSLRPHILLVDEIAVYDIPAQMQLLAASDRPDHKARLAQMQRLT